MRLPRPAPRVRLRTAMIGVAVVALAIGGWQMWERRRICQERARFYESAMTHWILFPWDPGPPTTPEEWGASLAKKSAEGRAWIRYYRYLADRPWLPLPDDPRWRD